MVLLEGEGGNGTESGWWVEPVMATHGRPAEASAFTQHHDDRAGSIGDRVITQAAIGRMEQSAGPVASHADSWSLADPACSSNVCVCNTHSNAPRISAAKHVHGRHLIT
ncbi:uncharacterized protein BO80DRAFT_100123 [Aspergillus ibericus CBS 121593]|uniref:Uncharacterized protein n=1 Tax=Aspergillus ibericus CBS 121593 TaxID=1448316 RepID=A0A395GXY7_9EURO|nr:hypothetical protein BO80DRAFT_100123 [Aspergillus ibericus CBS 121593]RAL00482.1 hypothetical protein BO80DRAFT_100123 [Aspergillus ibericus CBS 121593]